MKLTKKKKVICIILLCVLLAIILWVLYFLIKSSKEKNKEEKKFMNRYDEVITDMTEHSEEMENFSELLIQERDYIKENEDAYLEKLIPTLVQKDQDFVELITSQFGLHINTNNLLSDYETTLNYVSYSGGSYSSGKQCEQEIIVLYATDEDWARTTYDHVLQFTKISDHLFVLMVEYLYT